MNKINRIVLVAFIMGALATGCNKNDSNEENLTLKETLNKSAVNLNSAMDAITTSKAFSILTISEGDQKSVEADSIYKVYIPLAKIKGVYDYKPVATFDRWGKSLIRFFSKSTDNNLMVVNMPLKKVEHPRSLRQYLPSDSTLANNFSISVSDYHNNYNSYRDYDYILSSDISIDNVKAGSLNIKSLVSPTLGTDYNSQYAFDNNYAARYKFKSGDTTLSSFTIVADDEVLYDETRLTFKNGSSWFGREHKYTLTLGDIKIIRKSGSKDVEVYVKDVLQTAAVVEIIDNDSDPEASVCKKRDVRITFDDGTSTTVSALIGGTVENIKTLFQSLHQVYFAAYIIDWIAYDIYYDRD